MESHSSAREFVESVKHLRETYKKEPKMVLSTIKDFPEEQRSLLEFILNFDAFDAPIEELLPKFEELFSKNKPKIQKLEDNPTRNHFVGYKATWIEHKLIDDLKKKSGIESTSELLRIALMEKAERELSPFRQNTAIEHAIMPIDSKQPKTVQGVLDQIQEQAEKRFEEMKKEYEKGKKQKK
jgi:hypothetical protein